MYMDGVLYNQHADMLHTQTDRHSVMFHTCMCGTYMHPVLIHALLAITLLSTLMSGFHSSIHKAFIKQKAQKAGAAVNKNTQMHPVLRHT
jgi:hypothetical protein